jgi:hypothetical protein
LKRVSRNGLAAILMCRVAHGGHKNGFVEGRWLEVYGQPGVEELMSRAPFQVLVIPFRRSADGELEFCLLKRSDMGIWQFVAGGG